MSEDPANSEHSSEKVTLHDVAAARAALARATEKGLLKEPVEKTPQEIEENLKPKRLAPELPHVPPFVEEPQEAKLEPAPTSLAAPTAEQSLRQQIQQTPEPQPKESWFRKLINRLRFSKPQEQPQEAPVSPETPPTDEQAKWKEMAESRRGDLDRAATSYRIEESQKMGPLSSRK